MGGAEPLMRREARLPPRVWRRISTLPLAPPCRPRVAHRTQRRCRSLAQAWTPPSTNPGSEETVGNEVARGSGHKDKLQSCPVGRHSPHNPDTRYRLPHPRIHSSLDTPQAMHPCACRLTLRTPPNARHASCMRALPRSQAYERLLCASICALPGIPGTSHSA